MADIFVSFTSSDRNRPGARKARYGPHIHQWKSLPAATFRNGWRKASKKQTTACFIGKICLTKPYSSWERRAAQWAATSNKPNFALPALHGLSERETRAALAEFLTPAQRPAGPQPFPGGAETTPSAAILIAIASRADPKDYPPV